ncbi:MAG: hypothetical protein U0S50_16545 [Sphingopyxis sp.]|uniref:hypothetical protein n=1 Tax=Sphingopyxis sp. TaxID=1908224 RepID=UPI002AB94C3C|nr:hypothetical protein [Sphingopyxis sp.]MDZ3833403.1 hypothetical protein [Sphingopyxis sp.]
MTVSVTSNRLSLPAALALTLSTATLLAGCSDEKNGAGKGAKVAAAGSCPEGLGWAEGLGGFLTAEAKMDTRIAANADDCLFNQWSWESFVWATAEIDGAPRFLGWKTPDELVAAPGLASRTSILRLDAHMKPLHAMNGVENQDGAIVEADGSMLIGQNGYPVYASVHMTDGYFATVKRNLIATGAYQKNPDQDDYFAIGDAIVKATWHRIAKGEAPPQGAYTTEAEVPILEKRCAAAKCMVEPTGRFETATVALVGLHVVGYTENHPEFVWATFEHKANAPMFVDNSFTFDASKSDPKDYTFYKAGTPFGKETLLVDTDPSTGANVSFDPATGRFAPATQVVQMNRTGGDTQPNGPANIAILNQVSQQSIASIVKGTPFQNYNLIGTVWFQPNSYVTSNPAWTTMSNRNAVGAISLMNSTAETFLQSTKGNQGNNCFECHNAGSFSYQGIQPAPLATRRVAISHMVAVGSPYEIPNRLPVKALPDAPRQ